MEEFILDNGIKVLYEYKKGNISSFCIGFGAGANFECENEIGLAHVVEHMVFKGTSKRSEDEINNLFDETFGFYNAMTNYPYVIYYGTTLSEDLKKGFELYSNVILDPIFPQSGFKEEINVICQEKKEWENDISLYCEDMLFYNAFNKRRIKSTIIGDRERLASYSLDDVRAFYSKWYFPENCVISVVSSLDLNQIIEIVNEYFGKWKKRKKYSMTIEYENNLAGKFYNKREDINGARIEYCFPIHNLNSAEMKYLNIFNLFFGGCTSSLLYDEIRTKNGLSYEISSSIKDENGIKLFIISLGTAKEKVEKSIELIDRCIGTVKKGEISIDRYKILQLIKMLKLKMNLKVEKSIEFCKYAAAYEIMFGSYKRFFDKAYALESASCKDIINAAGKALNDPSIEIIY